MARLLSVSPRLHVRDLAAAVAFYRDVLGFRLTTLFPADQPTFALLARDSVDLQLGGPQGRRDADKVSTCTLWFDTADVVALHAAVRASIAVEWGPEVYFYGRREFAVRDPDGNLLVFSEQTSDPPTCKD